MSTQAPYNVFYYQSPCIPAPIGFSSKTEEVFVYVSTMHPNDPFGLYQITSSAFLTSVITHDFASRMLNTATTGLVRTPIAINKTFYHFKGDPKPIEIQPGSSDVMINLFNRIKQQAVNEQISVMRIGNAVIIKQN